MPPEKPKKEGSNPKEETEDKWAVEKNKDHKGLWPVPMVWHLALCRCRLLASTLSFVNRATEERGLGRGVGPSGENQ